MAVAVAHSRIVFLAPTAMLAAGFIWYVTSVREKALFPILASLGFFLVLVSRLLTCLALVVLGALLLLARKVRVKFAVLVLSARAKKKSIFALDAFSLICYNSISSNNR